MLGGSYLLMEVGVHASAKCQEVPDRFFFEFFLMASRKSDVFGTIPFGASNWESHRFLIPQTRIRIVKAAEAEADAVGALAPVGSETGKVCLKLVK